VSGSWKFLRSRFSKGAPGPLLRSIRWAPLWAVVLAGAVLPTATATSAGRLTVEGPPEEESKLTLSAEGPALLFTGKLNSETVPSTCESLSRKGNEFRCPITGDSAIEVVMGADADKVEVLSPLPLPLTVNLADGAGLMVGNEEEDTCISEGADASSRCIGNGGDDVCVTNGGSNACEGGPGDDLCETGEGEDLCKGGPGNDVCKMGSGSDGCEGGPGNDLCEGEAGEDRCKGGPGDDVCTMGAESDGCEGGPGNDLCEGGPGSDHCIGGPGDDICKMGSDDDRCDAGPGDDRLYGEGGADYLSGGAGIDFCDGAPGVGKSTSCEKGPGH
jgi:hypothetical protein